MESRRGFFGKVMACVSGLVWLGVAKPKAPASTQEPEWHVGKSGIVSFDDINAGRMDIEEIRAMEKLKMT